jgi:hypothetical protein
LLLWGVVPRVGTCLGWGPPCKGLLRVAFSGNMVVPVQPLLSFFKFPQVYLQDHMLCRWWPIHSLQDVDWWMMQYSRVNDGQVMQTVGKTMGGQCNMVEQMMGR